MFSSFEPSFPLSLSPQPYTAICYHVNNVHLQVYVFHRCNGALNFCKRYSAELDVEMCELESAGREMGFTLPAKLMQRVTEHTG